MGNVVQFVPTSTDVVQELEELLIKARAGQIKGIAFCVTCTSGACIGYTGSVDSSRVVAALSDLAFRIITS